MDILISLLLLAISAVLLWAGAVWIVESASAIARKFNLSELTIGLTIVALGTSLPEFLVTATAAIRGYGDISLSNVIGSNIFNLGIILGLIAVITPIPASKTLIRRDIFFLILLTLFILVMMLDLTLSRMTGIALVFIFVSYNFMVFFRGARLTIELDAPSERKAVPSDYIKLVAGFAMIALGGHYMVNGATSLAELMGVSQWAIGVTIVAAGTSLPELITCLVAAMRHKNDMLLGNLIGSDIFNFAGVLGLTCILNPINISGTAIPSMLSLLLMLGFVTLFMRTGFKVGRLEGLFLILFALGRWTLDFTIFT
ncbi:calcium/sodium antiporter [Desulfonatronovibrio magnus]|uniref:calcium/sodium antiporter n=1 Tax=Desulfonatronovibrio magnus TaxID=698827 RepID=UPI0005EB0CF2|nr:calcium/sodium antiporter [Desulfonatronovibrio magnus]